MCICIWCLFGPFLERKLKRPRHLQSTLRNEPLAAGLSLSAIVQESHATPRGAILIKLETTASLSSGLQRQPFSCVYCRHILPGTLSKHNSMLQINTQHWTPSLFSSLCSSQEAVAVLWDDRSLSRREQGQVALLSQAAAHSCNLNQLKALLKVCCCNLG